MNKEIVLLIILSIIFTIIFFNSSLNSIRKTKINGEK